jgi:pyruvate dehydrogenase E2 component (dihydrolipoamide acetyltransferase)
MATNVTMPSMGFDMTEGKVARWLKKIGDAVTRGETIGEIETEKATVDLAAPVDGVFAQILVEPGNTVPVNTPIAVIAAPGETLGAPAPQTKAAPETQVAPSTPSASTTAAPAAAVATAPKDDGRIKVSPLARNLAKAAGIDLNTLKGTGPGGRIIERDVEQAIAAKKAAPAPAAAPSPAAPMPTPPPAPISPRVAGEGQAVRSGEQALSKMRQTIARRLLESKQTIPHYYLTMEINMGEAMKLREQLNAMAASDAEKLSVTDLIVAAAARTLQKFPNVNAYFQGDRIAYNDAINVGVAVAVEDGLLTPVLHNADQKSLKQIAVETKELAARARANKMKPEDLGPGTFTISNLGMYGIDEFSAIINPPESCILAVGAVKKTPVVVNDSISVAQMMKVTLSADHRIVDGALGAQFLQALKKLLENPVNLLLG